MKKNINKIWKNKNNINFIYKYKKSIENIIYNLNIGKLRVCEKKKNWIINIWIKKAIILYIKIKKNKLYKTNISLFYDKIKNKFTKTKKKYFKKKNIRILPYSYVRYGSYISSNVIIMPSFVNIGAFIGKNTLIDTWATVGSCAYLSNNIHLSGGSGIGGVIEPLQGTPVIIEKKCFIGARSEIVEGVLIKKSSVISMGVFIGKSTKIYDRIKKKFYKYYIPKYSVVIPGTINYGIYSLYSVIIVKKVDKITKNKVKLNKYIRKC
ncbi:2,3,4,5-tetrahydropyridine-2,6-dicarboxylate N-succinyltransferase [Candidatus Vidania fulgoroideorum]